MKCNKERKRELCDSGSAVIVVPGKAMCVVLPSDLLRVLPLLLIHVTLGQLFIS